MTRLLQLAKQPNGKNGRSRNIEFATSGKMKADRLDTVLCPRVVLANHAAIRFSTVVASDCTGLLRRRGVCWSGIAASKSQKRFFLDKESHDVGMQHISGSLERNLRGFKKLLADIGNRESIVVKFRDNEDVMKMTKQTVSDMLYFISDFADIPVQILSQYQGAQSYYKRIFRRFAWSYATFVSSSKLGR